ncbi:MAG: DUF4954 family protein [Phycisphaerae bacterium]|nr:DUF4954 family protein [Phycisphaerae bacterium]
MTHQSYRKLGPHEIETLMSQQCFCDDWGQVEVAEGFHAARVRESRLIGRVRIGNTNGTTEGLYGELKDCGVYGAVLINCVVGDRTRIANIGVHIANYVIGNDVCIENVGTMQTRPGAGFGNGVEIAVLNEGGGREVVLFNELSAQFAYVLCLHRYRPGLAEKMKQIALDHAAAVRSDQGSVGDGAKIYSTAEIVDVHVGPSATINGAASLINGTILAAADAPTVVGSSVSARDFIIAEGSHVTGGAILEKVFVGQGCRIGRQFSAENSLFFANCEGFHGEASSVFAGPYTVTHHKSTLLIAGLFSFYNAGSGTNQSNHMYKLGPVHEGKLERGTKTGSFSYMMWPCRTGPFSVVLGKHTGTFDLSDFPFSHIEARADGKAMMVPALHLTTVGTVRDGEKWPKRDRRTGSVKRDMVNFEVFSPYTVGKMIRARDALKALQDATDISVEEVNLHGAVIRRPILRTGQKYYRTGIEMYLLGKVVERLETALAQGVDAAEAMIVDPGAVYSEEWVDSGGQLAAKRRIEDLETAIEKGEIASAADFAAAVNQINDAYAMDEWAWVVNAYRNVFEKDLLHASKESLLDAVQAYLKVRGKFLTLVLADAQKEFDPLSQSGFGQDGTRKDIAADFEAVRGTPEQNAFVRAMKESIAALGQRIAGLQAVLKTS